MTKQEAFLCDLCFEIKHFPQYNIFHLEITPEHDPNDSLKWDLCHDDYERVMKALQLILEDKFDELLVLGGEGV